MTRLSGTDHRSPATNEVPPPNVLDVHSHQLQPAQHPPAWLMGVTAQHIWRANHNGDSRIRLLMKAEMKGKKMKLELEQTGDALMQQIQGG